MRTNGEAEFPDFKIGYNRIKQLQCQNTKFLPDGGILSEK